MTNSTVKQEPPIEKKKKKKKKKKKPFQSALTDRVITCGPCLH